MRKLKAAICLFSLLSAAPAAGPGCPSDMVLARPGVCIDRYEWPNKKGKKPRLAQSATMRGLGGIESAEDFCAYHGKRSCTRTDWVAACVGDGGAKLPYGHKYAPGKCNVDKRWKSVDPYKVEIRDEDELARLDQSEPSGSNEACMSASGAYDMVGNAEEWVRCDTGQPDEFGNKWCLVGGYWASPDSSCSYVITKHSPDWHYYETGFRCCLDLRKYVE